MMKQVFAFVALLLLAGLLGCSAEVGSKEWCEDMREKPKSDWTLSETKDYAKHCVIE